MLNGGNDCEGLNLNMRFHFSRQFMNDIKIETTSVLDKLA